VGQGQGVITACMGYCIRDNARRKILPIQFESRRMDNITARTNNEDLPFCRKKVCRLADDSNRKLEPQPGVVPGELRTWEQPMPALLPIFLTGSIIVLAADQVPKLNYEPSCKAAATTGLAGRDSSACKRDEEAARDKLQEEWGKFNAGQRRHCVQLSTLGGSPSYVELLTCLEMARDAENLKNKFEPTDPVEQ
jgi:hypothetical protein